MKSYFEGIKEIPNFRGAREFVEFLGPRNMLGKFVMGETPNGGITIVGRDVPCRLRRHTKKGEIQPSQQAKIVLVTLIVTTVAYF